MNLLPDGFQAVRAPLLKYNFILEHQEGIAPASGTEATATTLRVVDEEGTEDEKHEEGVEGRRVGGGSSEVEGGEGTDSDPAEEATTQTPYTEPAVSTATPSTTTPSTTTPSTTTHSTTKPSTTTPSTTTPPTTTPSTTTSPTISYKPRSTTQIPKTTTVIPRDSGPEEVDGT
jgi:hypothetical protein